MSWGKRLITVLHLLVQTLKFLKSNLCHLAALSPPNPFLGPQLCQKSMLASIEPVSSPLMHPYAQRMHFFLSLVFRKQGIYQSTTYERKFYPKSTLEIGNIWHLSLKQVVFISGKVCNSAFMSPNSDHEKQSKFYQNPGFHHCKHRGQRLFFAPEHAVREL